MIDTTTIRVIGLMIFSGCMTAWADDEPTSENIEPQPLNEALREFADRSGLQVVYRTELAVGIETGGTDTPADDREALDQLLASTASSTIARFRFRLSMRRLLETRETRRRYRVRP